MHGAERASTASLGGLVGREWAGLFEVIRLVMGRRVSRRSCEVSENEHGWSVVCKGHTGGHHATGRGAVHCDGRAVAEAGGGERREERPTLSRDRRR